MPQFCILLYANYTILATQRGGMAQCPPPYIRPCLQLKCLGPFNDEPFSLGQGQLFPIPLFYYIISLTA